MISRIPRTINELKGEIPITELVLTREHGSNRTLVTLGTHRKIAIFYTKEDAEYYCKLLQEA